MIVELGHFALILAFAVSLAQAAVPMWGAQKGYADLMQVAVPAAKLQFLLTACAFAALIYAFVVSDFSVALVANNSHSAKPMFYKVTGVWGNHEGSMLLWVLILSFYGAMVAVFGGNLPEGLKARVLSVQAMIGAAFFAFILFTSNPFLRLDPAPGNGSDMNPLLQDPGLAFHPPFLYLGYVGLSVAFSFAVAALIEGRVDAAWARWVRPWTLAAWCALTVGIALGSYWAYYELGWGGWWFWDPVENASLMPWLVSGALVHSAIVVEKRSSLKTWTILLSIIAFSLSLAGTFIVRSGIITSVHAFATDPTRGVFILTMLAVAVCVPLTLFAWRAPQMRSEGVFAPISREGGLVFNNLLLTVSAGVVFIGTLYPLVLELVTGAKISVGAPFFNAAFVPLMAPLIVALPIGAMLPWKRADLGRVLSKLYLAAGLALAMGAVVWALQTGGGLLAPVGLALATWLILGSLTDVAERGRLGRVAPSETLRRLAAMPRADWGKAVAHAGMGLTVLGVCAVTAWQLEDIRVARPGDLIPIGGYEIAFDSVQPIEGPNYRAEQGRFRLLRDGREIAVLTPEKRFYPVQGMPTTEAAIRASLHEDVYIVLGDPQTNDAGAPTGDWAVRVYVKPFANWIWIGALAMTLGGLLSLSDRRYRVGAGMRARPKSKPLAAPAVPAE